VKIIYFPENLTAKLQPLDTGIVFSVKAGYKASLASLKGRTSDKCGRYGGID
jgi:hypothetical protein